MTICIERNEGNLDIIIKDSKSTEKLNYIDFIERLYFSEKIEKITFPNDLNAEEKSELEEMIKKINETVEESTPDDE